MPLGFQRQGDVIQVNTFVPGNQFDPEVATLTDGRFIVTWTSNDQEPDRLDDHGIYAQEFDAGGNKLGGELHVNTFTESEQLRPDVIGLADGGFFIGWDGVRPRSDLFGESDDILGQLYDSHGSAFAGEIYVDGMDNPPLFQETQSEIALAALPGGGWIATWTNHQSDWNPGTDTGDGSSVYGRFFSVSGTPLGVAFRINTETDRFQSASDVAAFSDGSFVVVWQSLRQDGDPFLSVHGQVFAADGQKVGGEFKVNQSGAGDEKAASVTILEDGGFIVSWESRGQAFGDADAIYFRRYDASGNAVGDEVSVSDPSVDGHTGTDVAALPDGGWIIAWSSLGIDRLEVFARRFDADGEAVGPIFQVNVDTNNVQANPSLAVQKDGSFVVTWVDAKIGNFTTDISAQFFESELIGTNRADTITDTLGANSISGRGGNDLLDGGSGADTISGGSGNDVLFGGKGNDTVSGDGGKDEISGQGGRDTLTGGKGNDTLRGGKDEDLMDGGNGADKLFGQSGGDTMTGGAGNDRLNGGGGNDVANGGGGDDFLKGGTRKDKLDGGSGNDRLFGNSFDDTLNGGSGDDTLNAGGGDDLLIGGTGNDNIKAGSGSDIFIFADGHGDDTIRDFEAKNNIEKIDLSDVSAFDTIGDLTGPGGAATQQGADVLIDTGGGNSILLENVDINDLGAGDFIL